MTWTLALLRVGRFVTEIGMGIFTPGEAVITMFFQSLRGSNVLRLNEKFEKIDCKETQSQAQGLTFYFHLEREQLKKYLIITST